MAVALIGGTGLNQLPGLELLAEHALGTPWGDISQPIVEGKLHGNELFYLARHGVGQRIPPHCINYRANIWALRELGVTAIIAVNAVGGIGAMAEPGQLLLPDQLIDYTWGREHSFFDGSSEPLTHIDFTYPYDRELRAGLLAAGLAQGLQIAERGTYGVTQGPRLETAAEVERLRRDGCDVVGMTGMPEAALAAELQLAYAAVCLVVNPAAGIGTEPITVASMGAVLEQGVNRIGGLLSGFLQSRAHAAAGL